ncbi:hypothetical protein PLANPX_3422 [Lacipirellula parvula]|uniref:Uncharacterized protein n=1 Tax=Lacipirellula parvula TaxID=2650471 RepID=A0A5K7XAT3_9BACT|nr:hypothetical protein PLANPX_3422 [Lacipirellula parvula]
MLARYAIALQIVDLNVKLWAWKIPRSFVWPKFASKAALLSAALPRCVACYWQRKPSAKTRLHAEMYQSAG